MSSHHLVRDEQEPALFVHQLANFPYEILCSLLEWSPTVLCGEESIEEYLVLGHKLDIALVGSTSLTSWKLKINKHQPIQLMAFDQEQLLSDGLMFLQKRGFDAVNIITVEDQFPKVMEESLKLRSKLSVVIFTSKTRYILCKGGIFRKWVPADTKVTLRSCKRQSVFETAGFIRNLENAQVDEDIRLSTSSAGEFLINSNHPFVIGEEL